MKVSIAKVSLVALLLLLFSFSFSLAWDPPEYRNTGHTWDEKNGSTAYRNYGRNLVDGYFIIFTNPYTWVIVDFGKTVKKDGSTKANQTVNRAQ